MPPVENANEKSLPEDARQDSPSNGRNSNGPTPSPINSRPSSLSSSRSSLSPEVSALFRMFAEYSVHLPEIEEPVPSIGRGLYHNISIPREQNLLDLLRQVSGEDNVHNLREVRLRVLASYVSLSRLGMYCPRIRILKLDGSGLSSLREIGTSLKHLKILHVARCGLTSLDGTFGLTSIRELHAADNHIGNVGPCAALQNLKTIVLDRNPIRSTKNLAMLSFCPKLTFVSLIDTLLVKDECYREEILKIVPALRFLDGIALLSEESAGIENIDGDVGKSDTESISFDISSMTEPNSDDYQKTPEEEIETHSRRSSRSFTHEVHFESNEVLNEDPISLSEVCKAIKSKRPATSAGIIGRSITRISTPPPRPSSAQPRPSNHITASSNDISNSVYPDTESDVTPSLMTSGTIVCGNIGRALIRARSLTKVNKYSKTIQCESDKYDVSEEEISRQLDDCGFKENLNSEGMEAFYMRHPNLSNVKRLLDEPLPEKPIETTPVVELEFGVTGILQEFAELKNNEDCQNDSIDSTLNAARMWRKAFKTYRKHNNIHIGNEDSSLPLTTLEEKETSSSQQQNQVEYKEIDNTQTDSKHKQ